MDVAIVNRQQRTPRESFSVALPPVLILGGVLSAAFYGLILLGPLDVPVLRRYCTNHPVAIASVSLFFTGLTMLMFKWWTAVRQTAWTAAAASALRRTISEGGDVTPAQRPAWLLARWQAADASLRNCWFGRRVEQILQMQISRGRRLGIETDLEKLAEADADRQHDSYSLVRIINWAMPMLGFLGTVLGISRTLGQLDTELLATAQQEAMNQLTAGLYVAFDTTATALVLTVALMFIQFAINRVELRLLSRLHTDMQQGLTAFLSEDPLDGRDALLAPIREMTESLIQSNRRMAEEQAAIFSQTLARREQAWTTWTGEIAETFGRSMSEHLREALDAHVNQLRELQDHHAQYFDTRWKQWHTNLSSVARQLHEQQKGMLEHTRALEQLRAQTVDLQRMEEAILESTLRLEHLKQIEEASACMVEAVSVLAISLERAGVIRGGPVRPRAARPAAAAETARPREQDVDGEPSGDGGAADKDAPAVSPTSRKAA
ncbi:MAG: hypothetical protein D6753_02240 [Planctomycetota bacterium]|nr:MAG: hypothetical protein D6753_02240 [Planctomycetota bacterium]